MELVENEDYYTIENSQYSKFTLNHPFRLVVSGPTSTGKTNFIFRLLNQKDELIEPSIEQVLYLYGEWQPIFEKHKNKFIFSRDLNLLNMNPKKRTLLVIDDLLQKLSGSDDLLELFTQRSHHRGVSVILVSQNIFSHSKIFRTVKLNCTNYYLTRHNSDLNQLNYFARQIEPNGETARFTDAYNMATKNKQYGGLFISIDPKTPDIFKYIIFENEHLNQPTIIIPRSMAQFN